MKFSYAMLPDYPLEESLRAIELADQLGFHAAYAAAETRHKDLRLAVAAAGARTARQARHPRRPPSVPAEDPGRKDLWLVSGAGAARTSRGRRGPSVSAVT